MKRFHVNLTVRQLEDSVNFYRQLFDAEPTVLENDYAKWMLDDPYINFAINSRGEGEAATGIQHIGLQFDSIEDLAVMQRRMNDAGLNAIDEPDAECCYAQSSKTWVRDPDNVPWEHFTTHAQIAHFGENVAAEKTACPTRCCQ